MKILCFQFRGGEYQVDETGRIMGNGLTYFSDDWIFLGGSPHHWCRRVVITRKQAFEMPGLLNGCLGWDVDHGVTRQWGGQYYGRLPRITKAHVIEK
jgi:hypothetical protein